MRIVFICFIIIHGFLHLIGFAKAFFSTEINKQVFGISKPIGPFWCITFILFIGLVEMPIKTEKEKCSLN